MTSTCISSASASEPSLLLLLCAVGATTTSTGRRQEPLIDRGKSKVLAGWQVWHLSNSTVRCPCMKPVQSNVSVEFVELNSSGSPSNSRTLFPRRLPEAFPADDGHAADGSNAPDTEIELSSKITSTDSSVTGF
ncbi:hypothetical protein BZA05DRAFT_433024 [Tricharina praecox]|uniref:uncharacterized protein n=1 Tax=Tricharina praecox TaxID=43433 RepID=UPI0022200525|nr:uncharacterized protein BZA05DRAFT_433024 [Tricharina praecox]KAI5857561.1 hypothetical protein BZA05DRAFT_433024 [Tricharina praecox]